MKISKKNRENIVWELQRIRYYLLDMENLEDIEEVLSICQELESDIASLEEDIDPKGEVPKSWWGIHL